MFRFKSEDISSWFIAYILFKIFVDNPFFFFFGEISSKRKMEKTDERMLENGLVYISKIFWGVV